MIGRTLYLECGSGISGDMTVAALLDLGADQKVLEQALSSLEVSGFSIEISRVKKAGLDACDFSVKLDAVHENHDHDMAYLHGYGEHVQVYQKSGMYEQLSRENHVHEHPDEDAAHAHSHMHRGLPEIMEILQHADMTEHARDTAIRIFRILAKAEAKAHGVPLEQVHFHEVGAVDSIVDIAAAAVCLDNLGISRVIVPKLCEGSGFIRCQHGLLPVPVPAVLNIVQAHQIRLQITETEGELVTPTGAAIVAAICTEDRLPGEFEVEGIGIGAGKRTYDRPGILRAMLIREADSGAPERAEDGFRLLQDQVVRLETNVDDCTGESLGYTMERLLAAGARDVFYTPVFMKKNRPAYQINVLCSKEDVPAMEEIIFAETTTIGIRKAEMARTVLIRENRTIETSLGAADVKLCILPDGEKRCYPEYESAAVLARKTGKNLSEVYDIIRESGSLFAE